MDMLQAFFWLFLTVYHEARGESPLGQKSVVKVILNRASKRNWPISNIVLARKQFSCYNDGLQSPNLWLKDIPTAVEVAKNVKEAIEEWTAGDTLEGATHYYASSGPNKIKPPYWAALMTPVGRFDNHTFLREG